MKRQLIFIITLFNFYIATIVAQTLTGRAPSQVAVSEQFRLSYTINTQDVRGFRAGNIPEEFEVLMGPSTSTQSSFQMVNGHTSSTSSVTYTYIVVATKNGTFTIPPAHCTVDGKTVTSNDRVGAMVSCVRQAVLSLAVTSSFMLVPPSSTSVNRSPSC